MLSVSNIEFISFSELKNKIMFFVNKEAIIMQ